MKNNSYINLDLIEEYSNISFGNEKLQLEKIINIDTVMNYASFIKINDINFIYYRNGINNHNRIEGEQTKRFILKDNFLIQKDKNYILKLGIANHNFRLFQFNNKIFGVGGQALGIKHYNTFKKNIITNKIVLNKKIINYHKSKSAKFLDSKKYKIRLSKAGPKIFSPQHICPYFANGLHLFEFTNFNKNIYKIHNKQLPIINGIKNGRHDGHYGFCDNKNLWKSKNGLTIFDSNISILYIEKNNNYILYQRANIGLGLRNIQYCESLPNNLCKWSNWTLISFNPHKSYFETNYYMNNFFKIKDVNNYIGILMFNKKISNSHHGLTKKGELELFYSNDGKKWNLIGNIGDFSYHNEWFITGEPYIKNDKHYYFTNHNLKKEIKIYYFFKNRYSYIKNKNKEADVIFKKILIDKFIKINFKLYDKGYLKFQLLDNNKKYIKNYSFDDFNIIEGVQDYFEYNLKWNNNDNISLKEECFLQLKGFNFKIYSFFT